MNPKAVRNSVLFVAMAGLLAMGGWLYRHRASSLSLGQASEATAAMPAEASPQPPEIRTQSAAVSPGTHPEPLPDPPAAKPPAPNPAEIVAQVGDISITRGNVGQLKNLRDDQTRLDTLISQALLRLEFRKRGAALPERVIDERVGSIVANEFGGDQAALEKTLAAQGYTLESLRKEEREKIEISAMRSQILREAGVANHPKPEQDEVMRQWIVQHRAEAPVTFPAAQR